MAAVRGASFPEMQVCDDLPDCRDELRAAVAICALTALMPRVIALMALNELEFPGGSSHDSSHAAEQQLTRSCDAA